MRLECHKTEVKHPTSLSSHLLYKNDKSHLTSNPTSRAKDIADKP